MPRPDNAITALPRGWENPLVFDITNPFQPTVDRIQAAPPPVGRQPPPALSTQGAGGVEVASGYQPNTPVWVWVLHSKMWTWRPGETLGGGDPTLVRYQPTGYPGTAVDTVPAARLRDRHDNSPPPGPPTVETPRPPLPHTDPAPSTPTSLAAPADIHLMPAGNRHATQIQFGNADSRGCEGSWCAAAYGLPKASVVDRLPSVAGTSVPSGDADSTSNDHEPSRLDAAVPAHQRHYGAQQRAVVERGRHAK